MKNIKEKVSLKYTRIIDIDHINSTDITALMNPKCRVRMSGVISQERLEKIVEILNGICQAATSVTVRKKIQ